MKVAILGCGNMASAIVSKVYLSNPHYEFFTYTPSKKRAIELAEKVSGNVITSLSNFSKFDMVIIACKPQQLYELAKNLSLKPDQLVVSILAAVDVKTLQQVLNVKKIVRIMPNTPSKIGEGVSLMLSDKSISNLELKKVSDFFQYCSKVINVKDDEELNLLTVISGSGPAYVFEFASYMQTFLISKGISADVSKQLIDQLFVGASHLMQESNTPYSHLVNAVTSKAGVTIEAINTFRKENLSEVFHLAFENAYKRGEEISNEVSRK